ncbi:MAG: alanine--tRNA ligase [Phycisphaeraceae bacterium]|nr:alanine--tRNA ligase [Phycisphaeraceae bacterium]
MPASRDIRQQYLDYFAQQARHTIVPSSPVVPLNDPTLLFTNAGMNQFKPYFLGTENPPPEVGHRVVDTQKCIRAGGKHNDLEDVGKDTYHHTFFEMLGNWSFGDYFKKEAIDWAWDLLVNVWGMDPDRLHATYFEGDEAEGLAPDDEAHTLWLKYLPPNRVHPGNKKDNFWEMGDTGPCGPCSEIHYDRTVDKSGGKLVNAGVPEVIEIWNLVFIQFNRAPGSQGQPGKLSSLPAKHVDTGMGFERLCAVLQGKDSNYDTDVFTPYFAAIAQATGAAPYTGELEKPEDIAYRVIADHIRCLTFALADGAHCGNDGRNYVLRRILRRAVRYGRQTLGCHEPFFHKLVNVVVQQMGDVFPEIVKKQAEVEAELREEEESFGRTLDRGIELFNEAAARATQASSLKPQVSSADAFKLHDTYGFPLDLTQLMAAERGMSVNVDGFNKLMDEARERSRADGGTSGGVHAQLTELVQQNKFDATIFLGYETTQFEGETSVRAFRKGRNCGRLKVTDEPIPAGREVAIVLGQTPFYAESGGQVGDTGTLVIDNATIEITDTQKIGDVFFHLGKVTQGSLPAEAASAAVNATVDASRRALIQNNHTMTHVMNRALRDHVNPEADQKGSLVDPDKTRFDFSNNKAVPPEAIEKVEQQVNADIAADLKVYWDYAPQAEAMKINGLRAVFGEKYPPNVRVVSIGAPPEDLLKDPSNPKWQNLSIEFCGGTHLPSTGKAEAFAIISEEAVSKGVRRITALTGPKARQAIADGQQLLRDLDAVKDDQLAEDIERLTRRLESDTLPLLVKAAARAKVAELGKKLKQQAKADTQQQQQQVVEQAQAIAESADGVLIVARLEDADANMLRTAVDVLRKKHAEAAILLASPSSDGKVAIVASCPQSMIARGLKAGDWVREVAKIVGGGGGGKPDMAQAGGKDASKIDEALETAKTFATGKSG